MRHHQQLPTEKQFQLSTLRQPSHQLIIRSHMLLPFPSAATMVCRRRRLLPPPPLAAAAAACCRRRRLLPPPPLAAAAAAACCCCCRRRCLLLPLACCCCCRRLLLLPPPLAAAAAAAAAACCCRSLLLLLLLPPLPLLLLLPPLPQQVSCLLRTRSEIPIWSPKKTTLVCSTAGRSCTSSLLHLRTPCPPPHPPTPFACPSVVSSILCPGSRCVPPSLSPTTLSPKMKRTSLY
jgi:hypothetical protein